MFSQSYIENILNDDPSWQSCVDLHSIHPSEELERLMGGLASALRSGSEITHEDWGDDWLDFSVVYLTDMNPIKDFAVSRRYEELDEWLQSNDDLIIRMIHAAYSDLIKSNGGQGGGGNSAAHRASPLTFGRKNEHL